MSRGKATGQGTQPPLMELAARAAPRPAPRLGVASRPGYAAAIRGPGVPAGPGSVRVLAGSDQLDRARQVPRRIPCTGPASSRAKPDRDRACVRLPAAPRRCHPGRRDGAGRDPAPVRRDIMRELGAPDHRHPARQRPGLPGPPRPRGRPASRPPRRPRPGHRRSGMQSGSRGRMAPALRKPCSKRSTRAGRCAQNASSEPAQPGTGNTSRLAGARGGTPPRTSSLLTFRATPGEVSGDSRDSMRYWPVLGPGALAQGPGHGGVARDQNTRPGPGRGRAGVFLPLHEPHGPQLGQHGT